MPKQTQKVPPSRSKVNVKNILKRHIAKGGLKIPRYFTRYQNLPLEHVEYETRTSRLTNPDGKVVFEMKNVEVPKSWSQVATDILAQKYMRKKGVPQLDATGKVKKDKNGEVVTGAESSVRQVVSRLAGTWRYWGEKYGYFSTKKDADAFEEELQFMLVHQMAAPNSPQWFNTGLHHAYGITGESQGHCYVDPATEKLKQSTDAYTRPQPHACFIQSVQDDMVNEGGIFDLILREALLFKYGSGTGTNFSNIRGKNESLSGGGQSSGLMSFLSVLDRSAGSIKSGGTTRRAAKMVCLDMDHPEIEDFINWKVIEEQKVAALHAGSHVCHKHLKKILQSANENGIDPEKNPQLKRFVAAAKRNSVPLNYVKRVLQLSEQGVDNDSFNFETYDMDFRSEAYTTVGGQNSNNSVRISNEFIEAVQNDTDWDLINRTDGNVYKTLKARDLWDQINCAAWSCADPGLQYDSTINEWHTCPESGRINASNPCSEYMFLDDTACNLASLNLVKFFNDETQTFDTEGFKHASRLWTVVLEISVLMAQFPSPSIAKLSYNYRTLGLGYANIGTLLMRQGIPYDSPEGEAICGAITAMLCGESYATSAEMAKIMGPFKNYADNKDHMLRVIRNHRRAAYRADEHEYENLTIKPQGIDSTFCPQYLLLEAQECWDRALVLGEKYGFRNAQTTVIAPTGTIGLLMDCDTTGIEPDFALVKFKKLVGGGYFKIVNQSLEPALKKLGYTDRKIQDIVDYCKGKATLDGCPYINVERLAELGFGVEQLQIIDAQLHSIFELKFAFNKWSLGEKFCKDVLGFTDEQLNDPDFDMLVAFGFSESEIKAANEYICGSMTVEGAPHLKKEHLPVFDCANRCGNKGRRYIEPLGHVKMMAAAQPFISGAISKTINMPEEATVADIDSIYMESWRRMLKANAIYRDGSKLSQALTTSSADNYSKLFDLSEEDLDDSAGPEVIHKVIEKIVEKPVRHKLPAERHSITHKFSIASHEGYLTVGLYEDGTPGELFIKMSKEGSTLSGIMDAFALSISLNLQYGVPLEVLISKFSHTRFEPSGMTANREIPIAQSVIDYLGRWLALRFLPKETAKKYHSEALVDRSYLEGSLSKVHIPIIEKQVKKITDRIAEEQNVLGVVDSSNTQNIGHRESLEASSGMGVISKDEFVQETSVSHFDKNSSEYAHELVIKQVIMAARQNNEGAPMCSTCGLVMQRNGSCFKCNGCGETSGCS